MQYSQAKPFILLVVIFYRCVLSLYKVNVLLRGQVFEFFKYFITLLYLPAIVSEDAGIEPMTVATFALAIRRSNHSARLNPLLR
jgi:hypothetical protein